MTSHIILWNESSNPSKVDLDKAMDKIPYEFVFGGSRILDIPDRGRVKALLFSTHPAEFDLDNIFQCTWTTPVIHDLDYPEVDLDNSSFEN